jgi:transglutaminase-like putative cysteine protease
VAEGGVVKAGTELRPLDRDLAATVALALYSIVIGLGFARVFGGWEFADDVVAIVVVGHGASFVLRRLRVSGWVAVPAVVLLLLWLIALQSYRSTFSAVFPTGATWDLFRLETGLVRQQFRTAVAPVLYGAGWATLSGMAIMAVVVLSDTFAFRAEARGEALVPGGVLYVFIAALGTDRSAALGTDQSRVTLTAALIATGFLAVFTLRSLHDRRRRVESTASVSGARALVLPTAVASAVAIGLLAGVIGPRLPGAGAEPLYHTRNRGGVTEVLSPLVDIRSRLVNRTNTLLFRVSSPVASNWRYIALPEFDGRRFDLRDDDTDDANGSLAAVRQGAEPFTHQIQIESLGGKLVPAAADPIRAAPAGSLRYEADTSTLFKTGDELGLGETFTIESAAPRLEPDDLRAAPHEAPPDSIYLGLPDNFPGSIGDLARQVTAGTTTDYDAAIALQNWFHSEFSYSLQVQSGHGTSAIESFLIEKVGYCEQFSATFAAMARTLGIPSRVAVGFTPGLQSPDGWYNVLGKNAHAWTELWFGAAIGWVPFDATPGRGIPGSESYTGIPAQQDTTPAQAGTGDRPPVTPTTRPTAATFADPDAQVPVPTGVPTGRPEDLNSESAIDASKGLPMWPFVAILLIAAIVAAPAVARRLRRRMLRRAPADERIVHAWQRATSSLRLAGVSGRPSMTTREWATATATVLPVAARPMWSLSGVVDAVTFGTPGMIDLEAVGPYGTSAARDCTAWAHQIDEIVAETLTPRERLLRYATDWG